MSKQPYSYTTLRYVHDVTTGEFVNVGVALFSPQARFANAICRTTTSRLKSVFPTVDAPAFHGLMQKVQKRFDQLHEEFGSQLDLTPYGSVIDFAHAALPKDDSALQWSPVGSGLTSNPADTLQKLFDRFVCAHERHTDHPHRRDDDAVWRHFSRALEQRQVLDHFAPQTFTTPDDEVTFDRAWKNGVWHCLAPVSFDLASADSIREKAHKWLGQATSIAGAEPLKLYFLVGEPSQETLKPTYRSALNILKKANLQVEVFAETQAQALSEALAREVEQHEASLRFVQ